MLSSLWSWLRSFLGAPDNRSSDMDSYMRLYVGASLTNAEEEPVEVLFDEQTYDRILERDAGAWRVLLSLAGSETRE